MLPDLRFVQIQTHSRCNADCLFCPYVESEHALNPGRMSGELWLKILDDLLPFSESLNRGKILPYFMQEPLLDKTIFRKIEDIYSRFPKVFVELSTNGAALTQRVSEGLLETLAPRRHALWVSFHGVDQATFEYIMKIDYDKALANLIDLLKRAQGRLRVIIRGAGRPRQGERIFFDRDTYLAFWREIFEREHINTDKIHVDAFTYHDRAGTLHREDRNACGLNLGKLREIGPGHPPFHCPRITDWLHVDYRGNLRLCCMDYHHEVRLPNLRDMSIKEYFASDAFAALQAQVCGSQPSEPDFICKRCVSPGG